MDWAKIRWTTTVRTKYIGGIVMKKLNKILTINIITSLFFNSHFNNKCSNLLQQMNTDKYTKRKLK